MDLFQLMRSSPFHRWLGVELLRAEGGEVEVHLPYRPEFSGDDNGAPMHGGIIASLADIACIFSLMSATGQDVPTLDMRIDYLRPALAGDDLFAVARTVKVGRTIGVADAEIRTRDGRLIAVGRASGVTTKPEPTTNN